MSYLTPTRYGLTRVKLDRDETTERLAASGWRQIWEHPSGMLAMRQPWPGGRWVVAMMGERGWEVSSGWSSSLRAAARSIERRVSRA